MSAEQGGRRPSIHDSMSLVSAALAALIAIALLAAGSASASGTEACDPAPHAPASFCINSELAVSGTTAAGPLGLDLSLSNTSDQFTSNEGVWVSSATISLLPVGTKYPIFAPSASMPDGLRLAGGPCSGDFSNCSAGRGTFAAYVNSGLPVIGGYHEGTFGIADIVNVQDAGAGNLVHYRADVSYCVTVLVQVCGSAPFDLVVSQGSASATSSVTLATTKQLTVSGFNADVSLKSLTLHIDPQSGTLADGSPAGQTYTPLRAPVACGIGGFSGTFTSGDSRTVSFPRAFNVTGCPTAAASYLAAGSVAKFDGGDSAAHAPARTVAAWRWAFGDGTETTTSGPTVSHTYTQPGDHAATLSVVDSEGAVSEPVTVAVRGTETTARVHTTKKTITAKGKVDPPQAGDDVSVELDLRKKGQKKFSKADTEQDSTDASGDYSVKFPNPKGAGTCKVVATAKGDATQLGSSAVSKPFGC